MHTEASALQCPFFNCGVCLGFDSKPSIWHTTGPSEVPSTRWAKAFDVMRHLKNQVLCVRSYILPHQTPLGNEYYIYPLSPPAFARRPACPGRVCASRCPSIAAHLTQRVCAFKCDDHLRPTLPSRPGLELIWLTARAWHPQRRCGCLARAPAGKSTARAPLAERLCAG